MAAQLDLHTSQAEKLKRIWLSQARKFADHANDLQKFIQAAHKWSDVWHATVWKMPDAAQQHGLIHQSAPHRITVHKRRCARVERQRYGKKMSARFPGTAGHRQR